MVFGQGMLASKRLYSQRKRLAKDVGYKKARVPILRVETSFRSGVNDATTRMAELTEAVKLNITQSANSVPTPFLGPYQVLSTNWLLCACVGVSKPMVIASLSQCTCAVVGNRPGRAEPRENKRRPKTLKLMKVPRWIFHAAVASLSKIT
ncbi:hypothetical protein [Rhodopirellula baltica]